MSTPPKYRVLLAEDAGGAFRVLATDSAAIVSEFEHCGTDAEAVGIVGVDSYPGAWLWLWEGTVTAKDERGFGDSYPEWVLYFDGKTTPLEFFDERLPALFAMTPPEDPEEDRDSPGVVS